MRSLSKQDKLENSFSSKNNLGNLRANHAQFASQSDSQNGGMNSAQTSQVTSNVLVEATGAIMSSAGNNNRTFQKSGLNSGLGVIASA